MKVKDEVLVKKILSGYGDADLRQLLQLWTHPLLCVDAIEKSKLPQTLHGSGGFLIHSQGNLPQRLHGSGSSGSPSHSGSLKCL